MPFPKRFQTGCLAPSRQPKGYNSNGSIGDPVILAADFQHRIRECLQTLTQAQNGLRSNVINEFKGRESKFYLKRQAIEEGKTKLSELVRTLEYEKCKKDKEEAELKDISAPSKQQRAKLDKAIKDMEKVQSNVDSIQRQNDHIWDEIFNKYHVHCSHLVKDGVLKLELQITHVHPLYSSDQYEIDITGNFKAHLEYTDASVTPPIKNFDKILAELVQSQNMRQFYESVISAWETDARAPLTPRLGKTGTK